MDSSVLTDVSLSLIVTLFLFSECQSIFIFGVYHTIGSLGNFKYGIVGSQLDSLPYA